MIFWGTLAIVVAGNGCQGPSSTSSFENSQALAKLEDLSNPNNGRTYDGKIVTYLSRNQIICDSKAEPELRIENNKILETLRLVQTKALNGGHCEKLELTEHAGIETFEDSQLAVHDGNFYDKVPSFGEILLDNQRTKIVCKLKHGEMLLLDNQWTGAVVMETPNRLLWNSRLDFSLRTSGTGFIFDDPPPGTLFQTPNSFEFRTQPEEILRRPGVYQSLYIKIDRPASDLASPSLAYGKQIYPGQIQYLFADYTQEPIQGVSTSLMDSICFVDQIEPSRIQVISTSKYDFIQPITKALQISP
jgi:hypothetical protein